MKSIECSLSWFVSPFMVIINAIRMNRVESREFVSNYTFNTTAMGFTFWIYSMHICIHVLPHISYASNKY